MSKALRRVLLLFLIAALLGAAAWRSATIVDETSYVVVTEFGRITDVLGDRPGETGLHFKPPWHSSLVVDRRLRVTDSPAREVMTADKRNLEVSTYLVWRVADPVIFLRTAGTLEGAEARLEERASAALGSVLGHRPLESLASIDSKLWALDALTDELRTTVAPAARRDLGLELVDIRLRRFNYPVEVRPAVFELIRGERRQAAAAIRAEGEAKYRSIVSEAEARRDVTLAEAEADAERTRGRGDAEAVRILNEAHARDPKFYEFAKTLETYRAIFDDRSTVVLSAGSPLLRLLSEGPAESIAPPATNGPPTRPTEPPRPLTATGVEAPR